MPFSNINKIITFSNGVHFFFSTSRDQKLPDTCKEFVPYSVLLPIYCAPIRGVESGIVKNIVEFMILHHTIERQMRNPDPNFEPPFGYQN